MNRKLIGFFAFLGSVLTMQAQKYSINLIEPAPSSVTQWENFTHFATDSIFHLEARIEGVHSEKDIDLFYKDFSDVSIKMPFSFANNILKADINLGYFYSTPSYEAEIFILLKNKSKMIKMYPLKIKRGNIDPLSVNWNGNWRTKLTLDTIAFMPKITSISPNSKGNNRFLDIENLADNTGKTKSIALEAKVEGIVKKTSIVVRLDGHSTLGFDFSNQKITVPLPIIEADGNHKIDIVAKNTSGIAQLTIRINGRKERVSALDDGVPSEPIEIPFDSIVPRQTMQNFQYKKENGDGYRIEQKAIFYLDTYLKKGNNYSALFSPEGIYLCVLIDDYPITTTVHQESEGQTAKALSLVTTDLIPTYDIQNKRLTGKHKLTFCFYTAPDFYYKFEKIVDLGQ